jgi:hypothetical protein
MSAGRVERIAPKLSHRAARWLLNFLQSALPTAMVLYVGLFTRMANIAEAVVILFVSGAFVCFSLFAASLLGLTARS